MTTWWLVNREDIWLRRKWVEDNTALCAFGVTSSAFIVELLCVAGVNYVCSDLQHGLIDYAAMLST